MASSWSITSLMNMLAAAVASTAPPLILCWVGQHIRACTSQSCMQVHDGGKEWHGMGGVRRGVCPLGEPHAACPPRQCHCAATPGHKASQYAQLAQHAHPSICQSHKQAAKPFFVREVCRDGCVQSLPQLCMCKTASCGCVLRQFRTASSYASELTRMLHSTYALAWFAACQVQLLSVQHAGRT